MNNNLIYSHLIHVLYPHLGRISLTKGPLGAKIIDVNTY